MKAPLIQAEPLISSILAEEWRLDVTSFAFLPLGDSAYCYRIITADERRYLLKLVHLATNKGQETEQAMRYSLPLTWRLFQSRLFRSLAYALPTHEGQFSVRRADVLYALYPFIEGKSLADAYPLSDALVQEIAEQLADIHQVSGADAPVPIPVEQFTLPFLPDLFEGVAALEHLSTHATRFRQRLRALILPQHERIDGFVERLRQVQTRVQQTSFPGVLCHGDVWGGNLIRTPQQELVLVDWESVVFAPCERDIFGFIGQIAAFTTGYQRRSKTTLRWNCDLLTFFAYRHQVHNLWQWMRNLLYEDLDPLQCENDLEMIDFHCLQRWDAIEATLRDLHTDE